MLVRARGQMTIVLLGISSAEQTENLILYTLYGQLDDTLYTGYCAANLILYTGSVLIQFT
jgi:hypothetical protein